MNKGNLTYQPEIDGLRAVAVILVLMFHFELGVGGGFVGVDVFFVISGYLITEVVKRSVKSGSFSFSGFYIRRLLRLQPALMVAIGMSLIAGFFIMDPVSLVALAQSAKYAIFAFSNVYYWRHQGYFEAGADAQPLLHTWSLAAEWQFYLVWPIVVASTIGISEKFLRGFLLAAITISLVASQWMLNVDASAAYFMMPFRIFELAIGALLTVTPNILKNSMSRSILTSAGLISIITSAFVLTKNSAFPGMYALPSCLGAAACIYSRRSIVGAALRWAPMVKIGIISYSVYLVHWPLLVFYKYYVFRPLETTDKIILLAFSLIVGAALYATVEKKFIRTTGPAIKSSMAVGGALQAALFSACLVTIDHAGILSRVPEKNRDFISDPIQYHIQNYGGYSYPLSVDLGKIGDEPVAVLGGDSFALQYAYGLDLLLQMHEKRIYAEFQHGCPLSGSYTRIVNNVPQENCRQTYQRLLNRLNGNNLPLIIAQHWAGYRGKIVDGNNIRPPSESNDQYFSTLKKILDGIRSDIGNRPLLIVGSQPINQGGSVAECLMRPEFIHQPCLDKMKYDQVNSSSESVNKFLAEYSANNANTSFIDPAESLCTNGVCNNFANGRILYSDSVHLSREGSRVASKAIFEHIN